MLGRVSILACVAACAPVFVADPYPPLTQAMPGVDICSWAYVGDGLAVTALHCIHGFPDPQDLRVLERTWDAALVAVDGELEDVPIADEMGTTGLFSVVCYVDFRGDPNCGHVLLVTDDSIFTTSETRLVRAGDSGSALRTREGGLVGVVVQGGTSPGLMQAARVPTGWLSP